MWVKYDLYVLSSTIITTQLCIHHAFLGSERSKPVIIDADLTKHKEQKLLEILRKYKEVIAWSVEDFKGISPSFWVHKILLEENARTSIENQRRLNLVMKKVVK